MDASFYEPRYNKEGKIVALADVAIADGIIVKGFRVIRGEKGLFASVPTKSFTVEGRTRYTPQVVFANPDQRTRFLTGLLEAYRKWEDGRSGDEARAAGASSHPPADELVE
jgi:DNA-binding cell septation regulator SpoVG